MTGTAKSTAQTALGVVVVIALIIGSIFIAYFFIDFLSWLFDKVGRFLMSVSALALALDLCICLPLAFFRWSRGVSYSGLILSSWVYGLTAFAFGFAVTYEHWGRFGVYVGLFLVGVGLVPTGLLAALFHAAWQEFFMLAGLAILWVLSVGGAAFVEMRMRGSD